MKYPVANEDEIKGDLPEESTAETRPARNETLIRETVMMISEMKNGMRLSSGGGSRMEMHIVAESRRERSGLTTRDGGTSATAISSS